MSTNTPKKPRPQLPFGMPSFEGLVFETDAELEAHQTKTLWMVDAENDGFPWIDAYLLGFGYKGVAPFITFVEQAPNSRSSLTGAVVVTMEDYLDHVYAYIAEEQLEQEILADKEPLQANRDYKGTDTAQVKADTAAAKSNANAAYLEACRARKEKLVELWDEYQQKIIAKKEAEAFHKAEVQAAYDLYMQQKSTVPQRGDFK